MHRSPCRTSGVAGAKPVNKPLLASASRLVASCRVVSSATSARKPRSPSSSVARTAWEALLDCAPRLSSARRQTMAAAAGDSFIDLCDDDDSPKDTAGHAQGAQVRAPDAARARGSEPAGSRAEPDARALCPGWRSWCFCRRRRRRRLGDHHHCGGGGFGACLAGASAPRVADPSGGQHARPKSSSRGGAGRSERHNQHCGRSRRGRGGQLRVLRQAEPPHRQGCGGLIRRIRWRRQA